MKIFNFFIILIICLAICNTSLAQASKKNSQMFTISKTVTNIKLGIQSDQVEILQTKGSRITVETSIKISGGNVALLEYLSKQGRYDLNGNNNTTEASIELLPHKNDKIIIIKGEKITEDISYKIYIPDNILFVETADGEQIYGMSSSTN